MQLILVDQSQRRGEHLQTQHMQGVRPHRPGTNDFQEPTRGENSSACQIDGKR